MLESGAVAQIIARDERRHLRPVLSRRDFTNNRLGGVEYCAIMSLESLVQRFPTMVNA